MHVGATLRMLRIDAGLSLRSLAAELGVSTAYLSRVENGHDAPPSPDRLVAIAAALGVAPTLLLDLTHRLDPFVSRYLERVPAASQLFVEIARRDLTPAELARVHAFIDETFPTRTLTRPRGVPRLASLIDPSRVVMGLHCRELDDAIDVAASRLAVDGWDAAQVAAALRERERLAPSFIGAGVIVPHATGPSTRRIALVSLARPLAIDTPDGRPIGLVFAIFGGPPALELLARVAALCTEDRVEELRGAESPEAMVQRLERLETYVGG
ncbi:MAG: PTS sugar transporter subunit IIA [Deltaproteobacteria bacterium]|nr:PTS sugar transporter subunit IIA [Deltaproteobacteria bacterium]